MPSRTLCLIKPDAIERRIVGQILSFIEMKSLLRISAIKTVQLTQDQAKEFYAEHAERSTFERLTMFMSSGPVVAVLLESKGDKAWEVWRKLLADVRTKFRSGAGERNAAHGSSSAEAAERELAFFELI